MSTMKWSESIHNKEEDGVTTPTIKNHSVTYHDSHLYCFGGYDGRRNHHKLMLYSLKEKRWLVGPDDRGRAEYSVRGNPPPGRNGHTATLALRGRRRGAAAAEAVGQAAVAAVNEGAPDTEHSDTMELIGQMRETSIQFEGSLHELIGQMRETSIQFEGSLHEKSAHFTNLEDSSCNPNHDVKVDAEDKSEECQNLSSSGNPDNSTRPVDHAQEVNPDIPIIHYENPNEISLNQPMNYRHPEDEDAQIIIIGGWLGSGPLAASDTWILDISSGLSNLRWFQPPLRGTPPGPCNMHSADYISPKGEVYVFRGGNGREYLNDLHALNVSTYVWRHVETEGTPPQQRANHSSAVLEYEDKCELFIFGGWNGSERLNDIFILDTETSTWSEPRVGGIKPHPRAGMTLTALRDRLYLFGGSGTSSKCFDDLQILDRKDMAWLDVNDEKDGFGDHNALVSNGNSRENDSLDWYYGGNSSLGGQDGTGGNDDGRQGGSGSHNNMKFADWRSQENHNDQQLGFASSSACTSANPNDEDMIHSVFVTGSPPGKRAGHTATAVGRFIYVFGGSCGTDYLSDFFVLDTDPPPVVKITEPASPQLYARRVAHFYNDEEFADVIFIVEGKKVYGHKLVLSTVSDCFRAMFMTGFRESGSGCTEIEIPDTNYDIFLAMMEYIYTGKAPKLNTSESDLEIERAIALLELADQFFLYNLKQICEGLLQPAVNADTYSFLMSVAQKTNSSQLELYCRYFERNFSSDLIE